MVSQSSIEWNFLLKKLALLGRKACSSPYQKCSVGLRYAKNALAAMALPRTPLGELTTILQTL